MPVQNQPATDPKSTNGSSGTVWHNHSRRARDSQMTSDAYSSVVSGLPLLAPVVPTPVDAFAAAQANDPSSDIALGLTRPTSDRLVACRY